MPWDERYRTGHPEIDRQHRVLFDLIDRVRAEGEDPFGEGVQVVLDLIKYVVQHLGYEEELMHRLAYPEAAGHLQAHRDLTRQVMEMRDGIIGGHLDTGRLQDFLEAWLVHHIGDTDRCLAAFLAGRV